jgi:hypothetical protein
MVPWQPTDTEVTRTGGTRYDRAGPPKACSGRLGWTGHDQITAEGPRRTLPATDGVALEGTGSGSNAEPLERAVGDPMFETRDWPTHIGSPAGRSSLASPGSDHLKSVPGPARLWVTGR